MLFCFGEKLENTMSKKHILMDSRFLVCLNSGIDNYNAPEIWTVARK